MRECGDCQVCCVVAAVHDGVVDSPAWTPCKYQCATGCSIYGKQERPKVCSSFECAWKRGLGPDDDRPDKIGAMFSVNRTENGKAIGFCMETAPDAVKTTARGMATAFARTGLPLIVVKHGQKPPEDRGDWVVIRKDLVPLAHAMLGPLEETLASDVGMYVFRKVGD